MTAQYPARPRLVFCGKFMQQSLLKISKKKPIIIEAMKRFAHLLNPPVLASLLIAGLAAGLLLSACKSKPSPEEALSEPAQPARMELPSAEGFTVHEPDFNITEIAILKDELVNTRFKVTMKIDNPNPFPLELSAFSYTLYGNGLLWADGNEKNVFEVPAESSAEANLFLLMNFIDMNRSLLNQIINLVDVSYRFAGEALVAPGIDKLPHLSASFDLSGYSQVLEK